MSAELLAQLGENNPGESPPECIAGNRLSNSEKASSALNISIVRRRFDANRSNFFWAETPALSGEGTSFSGREQKHRRLSQNINQFSEQNPQ